MKHDLINADTEVRVSVEHHPYEMLAASTEAVRNLMEHRLG